MKKAMEKLNPLKSKTAGKSGSSSSAPPAGAMEDHVAAENALHRPYVDNFMNQINALASGTVTGDQHVEQLAGTIGKVLFSVIVSRGVEAYWVALRDRNRVNFTNTTGPLNDPKQRIPHSLTVRTTVSNTLAITSAGNNLESIAFQPVQYKEWDLADPTPGAGCLFILTTQLSGCTFAIGCRGTKLYMGHAQGHKGTTFANTGREVGASLKEKRRTMFENVGNLDSTFLISDTGSFNINESEGIITYNSVEGYADVFGLVCNHKIYFIVQIRKGTTEVAHVVLLTQKTEGSITRWKPKLLL